MRSAKSTPKNPKVVAADAPGGQSYWVELRQLGLTNGLDALGVARAQVLDRARANIEHRLEHDLVNGMKFTFLRPERSTDPTRLVEGARSILVGARSYDHGEHLVATDGASPESVTARIARYAWRDHYGLLKESLNVVASRLRRDGHKATVFADDNSIVDREVAHLAGLGWYGKNANILLPGSGSMFVLGCVVTTAELPPARPVEDGCGSCARCLTACPTDAILSPGVIDANRCLSWLLQRPGVFDRRHREALGDRIYGCDECQTVCPPTKRHVPNAATPDMVTQVEVLDWLEMGDNELDAACRGWYVDGRNMTWVRRNLLIVLGNRGGSNDRTRAVVSRYLSHPEAVLRAHATWTAARLGMDGLVFFDDPDPMVQEELANLPPPRPDVRAR